MTSVFDQIATLLDPRFVRSALLQVLVFLAANGFLVISAIGWTDTATWWYARSGTEKTALVTVTVVALVTGAMALAGQIHGLLRMYQGYALRGPLRVIGERQRTHHLRIFDRLPAGSPLRYSRYPPLAQWVMPSALGNMMRSSETHAFQRYRIDSAVVWPRLYAVLPPDFRTELAVSKTRVDGAVASLTLALLFTVSGTAVAALTLPWHAPLLCLALGSAVSWAAHRGLLRSAAPYAELVRSAFDLHRGLVIDAVGWTRATSFGAERRQWAQICRLWYQGIPDGPEGARALGYPSAPPESTRA